MKIGINALSLTRPKVGVHNYIVNLVNAILQEDTENEYVVFVTPDMKDEFVAQDSLCEIPVSRAPKLRFIIRVLKEQFLIPSLLKKYEIDVYHCLDHVIPIFRSVKHAVVTVHDLSSVNQYEMHSWGNRIYFPNFLGASINKSEKVVCVSEQTMKDVMRTFGVEKQRVAVIYHGIDQPWSSVQSFGNSETRETLARYGIDTEYFLFVGTLEPRKNILTLIRSFNELNDLKRDYKLVITGKKGWYYSRIFDLVKELALEDLVIFTGYVPDEELLELYQNAKLFIYPSYYEGFGFPPLEAMACGTPTIVSDTPALAEVVGDSALKVKPDNVLELKQAITTIIMNPGLESELARKGRDRSKRFRWRKSAQEMINLYESLMH